MRGSIFTGSMSWTTGQQAESRWIFVDQAGQQSKVLTVSATGPAAPTIDNMIKTDAPLRNSLGLHVKATKTAHVNATSFAGTGGIKKIYAWCGGDELTPCQLQYGGPGSSLPYIFQNSVGAGWSSVDMHANALMQNGEGVNAVTHGLFWFGRNASDFWVDGYGFVGVQIQFQPITAQVFTGVNTWTLEVSFIYGN